MFSLEGKKELTGKNNVINSTTEIRTMFFRSKENELLNYLKQSGKKR